MPEKFIITMESFIGLYNIKKAPLRSALSKNSGGLLLHEGSVNRPDGIFRLRFVHADDDVDLRGTLVDDPDVDFLFRERGEELRRDADFVRHAVAHGGDEAYAAENLDPVRAHLKLDVFEDGVLHRGEGFRVHDDAHRVDGARAEFVGKSFAFEHGEHAASGRFVLRMLMGMFFARHGAMDSSWSTLAPE